MKKPHLSIVIPHWSADPSTDQMLADCVASLDGFDELIIVTNQPEPDGCALFSKWVNLGLRMARGEYRCVLNNDTKLVSGTMRDLCVPDTIVSPVVNGDDQFFWGCCFTIPETILAQYGGLDEEFRGYWEDLDYVVRMHQAGVKIASAPTVNLAHLGGHSCKKINPSKMLTDNELLFMRKHGRPYSVRELMGA